MNDMSIRSREIVPLQIDKPNRIEGEIPEAGGSSFGEWLSKSIASVNQMQDEGDSAAQKLMTGENTDIHGTMIAMQKASLSLSLMLEVRNKVISAYEEIKRMQF